MADVLGIVNQAVAMVAPEGILDGDDMADVEVIGIALSRLFDRNEKRGLMPRWTINGNEVTLSTSEPHMQQAAQERQAAAAPAEVPWFVTESRKNLAEIAEGRPPTWKARAPKFDPIACCKTTGATPAEARALWPDKAAWDGWLKARGKTETSPSEQRQITSSGHRPDKKRIQAGASEQVNRVLHHLRNTGQVNEKGEVNHDAPIVPLEEPQNGNGNGNGNGNHVASPVADLSAPQLMSAAKALGLRVLESDAAPEAPSPNFPGAEIPKDQRPAYDHGPLQQAQYDDVLERARDRARQRGAL